MCKKIADGSGSISDRFTFHGDGKVSTRIFDAFNAFGHDPLEKPPMYEWIDVETIDSLFESANGDVEVKCKLWGHDVTITQDIISISK